MSTSTKIEDRKKRIMSETSVEAPLFVLASHQPKVGETYGYMRCSVHTHCKLILMILCTDLNNIVANTSRRSRHHVLATMRKYASCQRRHSSTITATKPRNPPSFHWSSQLKAAQIHAEFNGPAFSPNQSRHTALPRSILPCASSANFRRGTGLLRSKRSTQGGSTKHEGVFGQILQLSKHRTSSSSLRHTRTSVMRW